MNTEKEKRAIEYLKSFQPQSEPYFLCYSGGKDSDCIKILAWLSGMNFEAHHSLTTVDAPETVQYVKSQKDVIIDHPARTMWKLIVDNGIPPTRLVRYCCSELKERGGTGRIKITGVRWAESLKRRENKGFVNVIGKEKTIRKNAEEAGLNYSVNKQGGLIMNDDNAESRRFVESCYRTTSTMINPIVDWTDEDVWDFLRHYGCKSNPLYQCGYKRIGCVGCPMGGSASMKREFAHYPKYKENYIRAFDRMLARRKERGLPVQDMWKDGKSVMTWWVGDDPAQLTMFDDEFYQEEIFE